MENDSTTRKHYDDSFSCAECRQSSDAVRQPTSYRCIELSDKQPVNGPRNVAMWERHDGIRPTNSKSLDRSTSDPADCGNTRPRWDGVSVWIPNTAAAVATLRRGVQLRPVQQSVEETMPRQSATLSPTTTSKTGNTLRSRGTKLLNAAGSTLARVWHRRPIKFVRNLPTPRNTTAKDEISTPQQSSQQDQTTSTICRKCHGRTVNNSLFNHPVGAMSTTPTATTRMVLNEPETHIPTVIRDLETESGYLIGIATSNSPNDVISCRTLPSTSPDDVNDGENSRRRTKNGEVVEQRDSRCNSEPSDKGSVVRVRDTLRPEDLLSWKLSLMDCTEGRPTTSGSWVRDNTSSSDDDEDVDCSTKTTSGGNRVESSGSEFSFENDFERALETPESPTTLMLARSKSDDWDVPAEDANDVEKLFDAKLDELLRTKCDVKTDQPQCLSAVDNDNETQLKQRFTSAFNGITGSRPEPTHQLNVDGRPTDRIRPATPPTVTNENTNSSVIQWRKWSSLPPRITALTGRRTAPSTMHVKFDPRDDVDGPTSRRSSSPLHASIPYIDDENSSDWHVSVGSVGCRFRSKSVPPPSGRSLLLKHDEPPQTERQTITDRLPEPHFQTQSASTPPRNHHRDETFSAAADDSEDFDCDSRTLTWRKLRNAIDDAVVELVDDLLVKVRRVDEQTKSELRRTDIDVDRLRRRLLRNVRTALRTSSELADDTKDKDDELQRLRTFVNVMLDCSEQDDVYGVTNIKKYVMTCPPLSRQRSSKTDKEIAVFVLRNGVSVDGLHVSVAGRDDLPVDATQDSREYNRPIGVARILSGGALFLTKKADLF